MKKAEQLVRAKGYDSEEIHEQARSAGMKPVISRRTNSKKANPEFHSHPYEMRHHVGNLFARLKNFRSITTQFKKLARNFKSLVYLACSMIWIKIGR